MLGITERFLGKLEEEGPVKVTEKAGGQGGRSRREGAIFQWGVRSVFSYRDL